MIQIRVCIGVWSEYAEFPSESEDAEPPSGSEYAESPSGSEYAESPSGTEYAESPSGTEYAESPSGSEYVESPSGSETLCNELWSCHADEALKHFLTAFLKYYVLMKFSRGRKWQKEGERKMEQGRMEKEYSIEWIEMNCHHYKASTFSLTVREKLEKEQLRERDKATHTNIYIYDYISIYYQYMI